MNRYRLLLLTMTALLAQSVFAQDANVAEVIANCIHGNQDLKQFHLKGHVSRGTIDTSRINACPAWPQAMPTCQEDSEQSYDFEDRFDLALGRSIIRQRAVDGQRGNVPESAFVYLRKEADAGNPLRLSQIRQNQIADDVVSSLAPCFAGFNVLEMLEAHPAARVARRGRMLVVEIPKESLTEYSEFGARVLVDTMQRNSLAGFEIYVTCEGAEVLLRRTEIERVQRGDTWVPITISTWEQLDLPTRQSRMSRSQSAIIRVDWNQSTVNEPLSRADIGLADIASGVLDQTAIGDGWSVVTYVSPRITVVPPSDQRTHRLVLVLNGIAVLVFAIVIIGIRAKRSRAKISLR